jgi:hypothetical protein
MPRRHLGAVRIYAVVPPDGVRVVGTVEVHAVNDEANIETLMPVFMKRIADLGATGGTIDHVQTGYEMRTEYRTESFAVPCGYRQTCWSSRIVPYTFQVRILSIQGRALLPADAPGPPAITYPTPPPPNLPPQTPAPAPVEEGGTPL